MSAPTRPPHSTRLGKAPAVLLLFVSCALCACAGRSDSPHAPGAPEREYSQGASIQSPPPVAEQRLGEPAQYQTYAPPVRQPAAAPQAPPASARNDTNHITLQYGETLSYISALYGVSENDLMAWNGLRSTQDVRAGQRLTIRPPHTRYAPPVQTAAPTQTAATVQTTPPIQATAPVPAAEPVPAAATMPVLAAAPARTTAPAPATPSPDGFIIVAPGQSLSGIARNYGVTTAQLREWNGLTNDNVRAGKSLRVQPPVARASASLGAPAADKRAAQRPRQEPARANASLGTPAAEKRAAQRPQQEPARKTTPPASDAPDASGMVTVQSGQNLSGIAAKYKVSTADLRQWNKLKSDQLKTGQQLRVRAPVRTHTVKPGESLGGIAAKYKVSSSAIMQKNKLTNANVLPVGKDLIIP